MIRGSLSSPGNSPFITGDRKGRKLAGPNVVRAFGAHESLGKPL